MSESVANDDMVEGFIDGSKASETEFPERLSNRGAAYRHGWLNGRDDRIRSPRSGAGHLRELARQAMEKDSAGHPERKKRPASAETESGAKARAACRTYAGRN